MLAPKPESWRKLARRDDAWPRTAWTRIARACRRAGAQGTLCPRAHHHHRADRAAGKRGGLRLHGAPLEPGDAPAVGGDWRATWRRSSISTRRAPARTTSASSSTSARTGSACRWRCCRPGNLPDAAAQALLRSARPRALRRDPRAGQAAVLDRHGRPVAARRDPRQARPGHPALRRPARAGLRLELAHLPDLDGGHLGGAADRGDPVPAQPDPPRAAACRGGRRLRQGPARPARLPAARAREVRQAAQAFLEMRDRIRHHVEQRTTMLAGVSHDLRTVLTRFKLELAPAARQRRRSRRSGTTSTRCSTCWRTIWPSPRATAARRPRRPTSASCWRRCRRRPSTSARRSRCACASPSDELVLPLKRQAFKRAVTNLVTNAARFGDYVIIRAGADEDVAAHRGRRRRAGHSAGRARQRLPAVLPAGPRPQPGRRATPAWGWRSPATSPAATAATSRWASSMGGLRATMRVPL